jgi:hypothetical protein
MDRATPTPARRWRTWFARVTRREPDAPRRSRADRRRATAIATLAAFALSSGVAVAGSGDPIRSVDGDVASIPPITGDATAAPRLLGGPPPDRERPSGSADREGGGGGSPSDFWKPRLSRLRITPARFALGAALPRVKTGGAAGRRAPLRFQLSKDAHVRFTFERERPGDRYRRVAGSFRIGANLGETRVRFAGRLTPRRRLAPGRYRLIARPVDALGQRGPARRATFTLLARGAGPCPR